MHDSRPKWQSEQRGVCLNKHKTTDMLILNMKGRSALIGSRILMQDNNKKIITIK